MRRERGRGQISRGRIRSEGRERGRGRKRCVDSSGKQFNRSNFSPRRCTEQLYEWLPSGASVEDPVTAAENQTVCSGELPGKSDSRFPTVLSIVMNGGISLCSDYSGRHGCRKIGANNKALQSSCRGRVGVGQGRVECRGTT